MKFHPNQLNGEFLTHQLNKKLKLKRVRVARPRWKCQNCECTTQNYVPFSYTHLCLNCYTLQRRYAGNKKLIKLAKLYHQLKKEIKNERENNR